MPSSPADTCLLSVTVDSFLFSTALFNSILQYVLSFRSVTQNDFEMLPCFFMFNLYISSYCWVSFHCMDRLLFYLFFFNPFTFLWAISSLGILQIMLLWTFTYKSRYGSLLFSLLSKYLGFGWSHHMLCISELLKKPLNHFPKWLYHFAFPHLCVRSSPFIFSSTLDMPGLLIISLMTNDDEHRFMCFYTLCYISMAAIINYDKLVGLKQQKVLLSQFWRLDIWNQFY